MKKLVQEYKLSVNVVLDIANQNLAEKMTHIPQSMLDMNKKEAEPVQQVCVAFLDTMSSNQIMEVH